jgi:hypothetical protein
MLEALPFRLRHLGANHQISFRHIALSRFPDGIVARRSERNRKRHRVLLASIEMLKKQAIGIFGMSSGSTIVS